MRIQSTRLHKGIGLIIERLETWALNPWRRFSLFVIAFLGSFLLGSSLGALNGALSLMDPIGAFLVVLFLECLVRLRRVWFSSQGFLFTKQVVDMIRIGLLYGLLLEGFKLF